MESPEWMHEESDASMGRSTRTTPTRNPSLAPADPIKKTRLFSLANSFKPSAATAATRTRSTQLNSSPSSFHSAQNLDIPNPFFESDYPSQRFRPEARQEEDLTSPYYSPPLTFVPPESPNNLMNQDQTPLAVSSSETQVRNVSQLISLTLISDTLDNEDFIISAIQGTKINPHSLV